LYYAVWKLFAASDRVVQDIESAVLALGWILPGIQQVEERIRYAKVLVPILADQKIAAVGGRKLFAVVRVLAGGVPDFSPRRALFGE
jgi:hypothetical protein